VRGVPGAGLTKAAQITRAEWDFRPWQGDRLAWSDQCMFVSAEALVELGFPAALAGLANLARGGRLTAVSRAAYGDGLTGLARVGPLGAVPSVSTLVQVQVLDVVTPG
jgi:hypothetical protein